MTPAPAALAKNISTAMESEAYNQLASYTLSHKDPAFIHQNIVDAYAAQTADENTKPIKIIFALVGLYLFLEKNFTGRQVQLVHMELAKGKKQWPKIIFPQSRGALTAQTVMKSSPGKERDDTIKKWCQCVWDSWKENKPQIIKYLSQEKIGL